MRNRCCLGFYAGDYLSESFIDTVMFRFMFIYGYGKTEKRDIGHRATTPVSLRGDRFSDKNAIYI